MLSIKHPFKYALCTPGSGFKVMKKGKLPKPYFVVKDDESNFADFDLTKEILESHTGEEKFSNLFPEGAVGVRVDEDFWAVAALPLSYRDVSLRKIAEEFWPKTLEKHLDEFVFDDENNEERWTFSIGMHYKKERYIQHDLITHPEIGVFKITGYPFGTKWFRRINSDQTYAHALVPIEFTFSTEEEAGIAFTKAWHAYMEEIAEHIKSGEELYYKYLSKEGQ